MRQLQDALLIMFLACVISLVVGGAFLFAYMFMGVMTRM